jgi:K+-transporting ATPase KdpF subunit
MLTIFAAETIAPAVGGSVFILYLTAAVTVAALVYLTYAMIRPERF